MKRSRSLSLLVIMLLSAATTSCDFDAASDAVDEFDVLVELPPLATVVNLQVLDASTNQPVSREVNVEFEGADASSVVDVYSDPLAALIVKDGFATFALDSSRSPAASNPAELRLRVRADGYETTSTSALITQEGNVSQAVYLVPENPEQAVAGRAGDRGRTSTENDGETTDPVSVQTEATSDEPNAVQGAASLPAGTRLQTAAGESLQGEVTTDLSVFDNSQEAQSLLPEEARVTEDGVLRPIRGGFRFRVRDGDGRTAARFGSSKEDTTTVTVHLSSREEIYGGDPEDGLNVTLLDSETGETQTVELTPPADADQQELLVKLDEDNMRFQVREPSESQQENTNSQLNDRSKRSSSVITDTVVTDASTDRLFFFNRPVGVGDLCNPAAGLDIDPNGQYGTLTLQGTLENSSLIGDATVSIPDPSDSFTVPMEVLFRSRLSDPGQATVLITTPDNQTVEVEGSPCSGTHSVTLPESQDSRIDATIRVEPDCPADQRIRLTTPVDGYGVFLRPEGSRVMYRGVLRDNITINTTDDDLETFESAIIEATRVSPNTEYEFIGVFGNESSRQVVTMPGQPLDEVVVTDDRLRDECE